jgi:hypothetical protein
MTRNILKSLVNEVVKEMNQQKSVVSTLRTSQREKIKESIRKIVIKELTQANFGVGKVSTEKDLAKKVGQDLGGGLEAIENPLNGKVSVDDGEGGDRFQAEITESGPGMYDVTVIKDGGDRSSARQVTAEKLSDFLKNASKEGKSYVDSAREKSINGGSKLEGTENITEAKKKSAKREEEKEVKKPVKQIDTADKATSKAEVKRKKSPNESESTLGGEMVDKIEKIIDRVLKNKSKADAKTPHLKVDTKNNSPKKLVTKVGKTPAIKKKITESTESDLNLPDGGIEPNVEYPVYRVYIPANVYAGKYYDHRHFRYLVYINSRIKTEQDAINWVNNHKDEVLNRVDKIKTGGKRYVGHPIEKNMFFKDSYTVKKTSVRHTPPAPKMKWSDDSPNHPNNRK